LLGEHQDGDGRELLRDRAQPQDVLGLQGHAQLEVGHAVCLAEDDLAVPHDGQAQYAL
jgi:hypothetical protein